MNKNKKIYIVLMLAMGFFMTSCSNFLEIQPYRQSDPKYFGRI